MRIQQFHLACALIEVVAQGDAVAPALDLPALGPELDVHRVIGLEHPVKGADVDCLFFRGNTWQILPASGCAQDSTGVKS